MIPDRSLGRRIVGVAALSVGLVMLIAAGAAAMLLKAHIERGFDSRLRHDPQLLLAGLSRDRDRTLVIEALPDNADYDRPLSGWYWLVRENDEVIARSRSLLANGLPRGTTGTLQRVAGPRGETLRVVTLQGMPVGAPPLSVTTAGPQSDVDGPGFAGCQDTAAPRQGAEPADQGLGLAITREVAAAYGGVLKLDRAEKGAAVAVLHFSSVNNSPGRP
jgi:hypothetical protein